MSENEIKKTRGKTSDESQSEAKQKERNDNLKGKESKKKKSSKNAEKKMKHFNGKAYENYSCYKLCQKIFLEDITKINSDNIISNQELIFDEIFDEIVKMAFKIEYNNINDFQKTQFELYKKYLKIKSYNKSFPSLVTGSESTSEYEIDKNDPSKTIKKVEFDLVLKNINGKYIKNYLEKMKSNNYQYINSFNIENNRNYNMCFEMTISSKDALSIKIPQILKYAIFLNFLYDTNNIFQILSKQKDQKKRERKDIKINIKNTKNMGDGKGKIKDEDGQVQKTDNDQKVIKSEDDRKQKKEENQQINDEDIKNQKKISKDDKKLIELIQYFNDKFKFIDLSKKTILFIVSNGPRKDFENIIKSLKNSEKSNLLEELKTECFNRHNLYFNYSSFDPEKFKEEIKNEIYNKKDGGIDQIKKDEGDKTNELIDKIKKLENENNEIKSEMRNKIKNLELEIENLKNGKTESEELKSKEKNQEEEKYSYIKKDNKKEENLE